MSDSDDNIENRRLERNKKFRELRKSNKQQPISIKKQLHVPSQNPTIILQNIDNINEYYGDINEKIINIKIIKILNDDKVLKFNIKEPENILTNNREVLQNGGDDNENTKLIIEALNKFLANYKYIVKENKLYTLYDMYNGNVVCIIANFNNLYIIQIKEDFFKDNHKILKKYNKEQIKDILEPLYSNDNLQELLS